MFEILAGKPFSVPEVPADLAEKRAKQAARAAKKESGVTVIVLLAIADGGKPHYDAQTAQRIAAMDIPCFACTPEKLPLLLERALKGQDLTALRNI